MADKLLLTSYSARGETNQGKSKNNPVTKSHIVKQINLKGC